MSKAGIADVYSQRFAVSKNVKYIKDNPASFEAQVAATNGADLNISNDFGDAWNSSLDSIDWFFTKLKNLGVTYTKDWAMPRFGLGLFVESRWSNGPIVITADLDWSAVDRGGATRQPDVDRSPSCRWHNPARRHRDTPLNGECR